LIPLVCFWDHSCRAQHDGDAADRRAVSAVDMSQLQEIGIIVSVIASLFSLVMSVIALSLHWRAYHRDRGDLSITQVDLISKEFGIDAECGL
jgi:hypothetical protein